MTQPLTPQTTPAQRAADAVRNALILAHLKAKDRRFSGEALTGFGAL